MPVNRSYGSYSGYGGTYSSYVPGMYTSSFASAYGAGRAGSQSPATLRANTPARTFGTSGMAVLPEEKGHAVTSPTGSYSSYYSRQKDFYTPSAYSGRLYSSEYDTRRERRTINTDTIDTEERKEHGREHAIPGEITRDTTLNVRGGKAVVRMVTTKLKESPYVGGGWRARMAEREEKEELTLGQRLALKHQIVERPKVMEKSVPPATSKPDSGEESEWTWETCSSSEAEDPGPTGWKARVAPKKKKTPTPPKRKISPKLIMQKARSPSPPPKPLTPEPPRRAPMAYTKSNTTTLCSEEKEKRSPATPVARNTSTNRWMDRLFGEEKPKPKVTSARIPNFGNAVSANKSLLDSRTKEPGGSPAAVVRSSVAGRPISWAGIPGATNVQDVQANIHTEPPPEKKPPSSSSSGSSSPPLYKYNPRKPQTYKGAGSQYFESSDEETQAVSGMGRGWRPGQPPRGDVVVKLGNAGKAAPSTSVINSEHSKALATNRALTSQAAISSKVPAALGEKYQIPGLFIKPSVKVAPKSVKPVEAKLTLKPEGTMSLTTKVVEDKDKPGYQSSIYTPSKSPLLDARKDQRGQQVATPTARSQPAATAPAAAPAAAKAEEKAEESGGSEWEYYTESEPSDEEEKAENKSAPSPATGDTDRVAAGKVTSIEKNGLKPPGVPSVATNGNGALAASALSIDKVPPKPLKPEAKKHPVKIEAIALLDKKKPVQTKVDMNGSKVAASAVAALRKTKPEPPPPLPEPIPEEDTGQGPGYCPPPSAYKPIPYNKSKVKPPEEKPPPKPKLVDLKPVLKAPSTVAKPDAGKPSVAGSKAGGQETVAGPGPISPRPSAAQGPGKANIKAEGEAAVTSADTVSSGQTNVKAHARGEAQPAAAQVSLGQAKYKEKEILSNNIVDHAKENAVPEAGTKKAVEKVTTKTAEAVKTSPSETLSKKPVETVAKKSNETAPKKQCEAPSAEAPDTSVKSNSETPSKKPPNGVAKRVPETVTKKPPERAVNKPAESTNISPEPLNRKPISPKPAEKVQRKSAAPIKSFPASPSPAPVKRLLSPPRDLDVLRQTDFDWTKSPSPISPLSPSPRSPSPMSPASPTPMPAVSPTPMTAASLDRLPSPLKNMFSKTENVPKEKTSDSPAWFDNVPSEASGNAQKEMNAMKADANRTQVKKSTEEANLIKVSDTVETTPWYDDEDDDMKELLRNRPTILREIDQGQDRRLTPEENIAVIKMYGGVMFPGGELERTPKSWLFKIRKALRGGSAEKKKQKDAEVSGRTGSTSSTSSMSSFTSYSKSPSPELRDSYSDEDEDEKDEMLQNTNNEAPTKNRPSFKKYGVKDFKFLRVLGKGSFGKVLLTELRGSQNYYAVKALKKDAVLEDDDIECTMIERKVLALGVKHPFLCHLFCTFQTDSHLFFVMEYLNGGDLMFHIQQQGRFDTERARFYSAEIVCALKFLHKKGIVYRDLKLDNLLLDYEGHIRIVDFGMCKLQVYLDKTADTFCGTPDYMAPEIIKGMKYTHSVDWWSFGVLLYEMLIGQSPFNGCDEDELFWSICNEQAYFPRFLSKEAKQLLVLLLEKTPASRLGVSDCVHGDIRRQPFFRSIDFSKLEAKQLTPPYKPKLKNPMDVSYFDTAFTEEPVKLTPMDRALMDQLNQAQFKGFSYTNRVYTQ